MSAPLLKTKLYIPPIRPEFVSRPRLIELLHEGLYRKLILVSAPAGFGKTTLLSTWVRCATEATPSLQVAWLSLDEGDNDPARFLTYLIAALQTIDGHLGEDTRGALQSPKPPALEELLTVLINQISAVPDQLILVLDDYHLVTAQPIHDALTFFLEHLPPQMHLVIATRTDPPLPIARLRGQGQTTELRQVDLRFNPEEAAKFLEQVMGLALPARDVAALAARTEGWIAGLQMAAVSLQGREDVAGFIQAFAGSDRFVMDYLVEEVLQRQPESLQAFLLQTSILDRLTGPLCDAVVTHRQIGKSPEAQITSLTKLSDLPFAGFSGQEVLEHLERINLFVVPLDDHREWYRYHRLFADLLRQRLCQLRPDLVPALHRRASEWYERHGLMAEAIGHALSAEDFERAADLIEGAADATWMRSEVATFASWVEALPGRLVRDRPMLGVYHAMALLMGGHPLDFVRSRLQEVAGDEADGSVSAGMAVFRALVAAYQGETDQSAKFAQQALQLLPEESLFLRSLVAGILGLAYMYGGDMEVAARALEGAARVGQQAGNVMNTVLALCHLAELSALYGRLREARARYEQALAVAVDAQGRPLPIAGMALIGLGQLRLEWNDLDAAARHLTEGIELVSRWGEAATIRGYGTLARVKQAQGDPETARELLRKTEQLAIKFDATEIDDIGVAAQQAQLWIEDGDLEAAIRWAEGRGLAWDADAAALDMADRGHSWAYRYVREIEYATLAQLLTAQALATDSRERAGLLETATALLERLLQGVAVGGSTWREVELLTHQAMALQALGDTARALRSLARALSLAEPEGGVRVFLDRGRPMANLLRRAASQGIAPGYASKLLAAFEASVEEGRGAPFADSPVQPLIEPLSERELDVLRLLAAGLSNPEIGGELYIAVSTVRSHLKSIYGKLNVHDRREAVWRAQELGLL